MRRAESFKRICTIFIILGLMIMTMTIVGCSQEDAQQGDTQSKDIVEKEIIEDETKVSTENVIGTEIALYPNAQLVYNDDHMIVYSTDATLDDLYNYYKNFPEFSVPTGVSKKDYGFFLETDLAKLLRSPGQDDSEIKESASGRILYLQGLKAEYEENVSVFSDEIWAMVPQGKNVIYFSLLAE